jgi:sugar phosphate isomerase/epimerase
MQLGFVSAILPDQSFDEVLDFAAETGFGCVEWMCWPPEKANRRYAGVTHIDVVNLTGAEAVRIRKRVRDTGVAISGLGYYPNPLDPDPEHRRQVSAHLKKVIEAAARLETKIVNTFVGRDGSKMIADNWPIFDEVWPDLVRHAERHGIQIGIENCPMLFSKNEWPGGHNLAHSPAIWKTMFEKIPSRAWGLNFDPSHLVWQWIDGPTALRAFGDRIVHFHAKDTRIDYPRLNEVGTFGVAGIDWHTPKLPGMGDVRWGPIFSALTDAGYNGPICIEVEDRAYEKTLDDRKRSLRQSKRFLEQFVA